MKKLNKKGFTMVEMLAAVTILGLLATIAIVTVTKTIEKSHKEYDKRQAKLFTTAAQTYFTDNRSKLPSRLLAEKSVTLETLIEQNYIDEIVNYKKIPFEKTSQAYVKKTGTGKYIYYSTLEIKDGEEIRVIEDLKVRNKESSDLKITVTDYKLNGSIRQEPYEDLNDNISNSIYGENKNVYYANESITAIIDGESTGGISSYSYKIEKLSDINKEQGKKYKQSNEIAVNKTSFEDNLTLEANNLSDGIYRLYLEIYGYDGETYNKAISQPIVIDKTKPTCTVSGGDEKWINTYRTVKAECKDNTSKCVKTSFQKKYDSEINTIKAGAEGDGKGGIVEDKAGNTVNCAANQTVKIDKTKPTCTVSGGDENWINKNSRTQKRTVVAICNDTGGSDCIKGNGNIDHSKDYSSNINTTKAGAVEKNSGGKVYDNAGNFANCAANQTVKIDKTPPTCSVDKGCYSDGENNWCNTSDGGYVDITVKDNGSKLDKVNLTTTGATGRGSDGDKDISSETEESFTRNVKAQGTSTVTWTAYDNAGNSKSCGKKTIKVDYTAPTCSLKASSSEVKFDSSNDSVSGVASKNINKNADYSTNTNNGLSVGTFYGHIKDKAGNKGSCSALVNNDKFSYTKRTCTRNTETASVLYTCSGVTPSPRHNEGCPRPNATYKSLSGSTCYYSVEVYCSEPGEATKIGYTCTEQGSSSLKCTGSTTATAKKTCASGYNLNSTGTACYKYTYSFSDSSQSNQSYPSNTSSFTCNSSNNDKWYAKDVSCSQSGYSKKGEFCFKAN